MSPRTKTVHKEKGESMAGDPAQEVKANAKGGRRRLKLAKRTPKKEKPVVTSSRSKLSPAYKLFVQACRLLIRHRKLFGGILLVYAILDIVLVGGAGATNLESTKSSLTNVAQGHISKLSTGLSLFSFLISSSSSASGAAAGAYQTMWLLLVSVVIIWALRQVYAGHTFQVRDAFYLGTYPIVPFILILLVIGLQLVPLAVGGALYSMLVGGHIVLGFVEQAAALIGFLLLAGWSFYMLCSSIFALYIVTLPDMTPMEALRSAGDLVRFRRWVIFGKLLFLPVVLFAITAAIVIPFAVFVTSLATFVFFVLAVLGVGVVHSYLYALYREML
jgi:hypothetical protein